MIRLFFFLLSAFVLSACGGGGGGNFTENPPQTITKTASIRNIGSVYRANRLGQSYVLFTTASATPDLGGVADIDLNSFDTVASGYNWEILEGNYIDEGINTYLFAYAEITDLSTAEGLLAGMSYNFVNDKVIVQAFGDELSGSLPWGDLVYTGYNLVTNKDASFTDGGTFTMRANFSTRKASISATGDETYMAVNDFSINTNTGSFTTTDANVGYINGANSAARFEGNFNGKNAAGVTGIYTTTGNWGFVGAIAGSR